MADESETRPAPKKAAPATRDKADVEALARTLFVELFRHERGTKTPAGIARDAVKAAREFFAAIDHQPAPAKE